MTLNAICRLCLNETGQFVSLTDGSNVTQNILTKLEQLFSIKIYDNLALPTVICKKCKENTNQFHKFWTIVTENQLKLNVVELYPEERLDDEEDDYKEAIEESDVIYEEDTEVDHGTEVKEEDHDQLKYKVEVFVGEEIVKEEEKLLYKCEHCSAQFDDKKEIETHMKVNHKKKKKYPSYKESKEDRRKLTLKTKEEIEKDDEIIRNFYDLRCNKCPALPQFQTLTDWRNHKKLEHNEPNPFISCCDKKLIEKRKVLSHAILHINPDSLKCKICGRQCMSQSRLDSHMREYHNPNGFRFHCEHCPKSYATNSALQHHLTTHLTEEEREQKKLENVCEHCNQGYITRATLINHIRNTHMKVTAGVCHICAKSYSSKQSLKTHYEQKHSNNPPEKKQCPICLKWMAGSRLLTKHINRIHKKSTRVTCPTCNKTLSSQDHLQKHVNNVHSKEPKYPCPHCEKSYRWPMGLKEHLASHYGEHLYKCNYCDKSCNSNSNMLKHKRQAHYAEYEAERKRASINNPGYERLQEK